jgi:chromosome segregation ATPase
MAEIVLPEASLIPGRIAPPPTPLVGSSLPAGTSVCALRPEFDLDRLSLWQDRHNDPSERLNKIIDETRAALKQTEGYLRAVEKDSADRLESIHFYQEKLKQAYADHAHNVAYIETRHAEIAAHVRISAEKDAIINRLNEDLARNVAYLHVLEAEIAAHIKVAADHNAIIARLNDQLRVALERRPASL